MKLDIVRMSAGTALDMEFDPDALKDASKARKFASLIRTYFEQGGYHIQFNIVSTEMLREARKYPENTMTFWSVWQRTARTQQERAY